MFIKSTNNLLSWLSVNAAAELFKKTNKQTNKTKQNKTKQNKTKQKQINKPMKKKKVRGTQITMN